MASIHLGAKLADGCVLGLRVESGTWKRMTPSQGFVC